MSPSAEAWLKTADRAASLSFCQSAPYLAAGSAAGGIDISFNSSSVLEVGRAGVMGRPK